MFFESRIKGIKKNDRVLEVGPGGTPYHRADVFLDLDPGLFKNTKEALHQRGSAPKLKTSKQIVYYDGSVFPFKDKEFDYVIASHVLEHVDDVDTFYSELERVSKGGYIEFPTIYYDYLYNIDVHYNLLHYNKKNRSVYWMKKDGTPLKYFQPVQDLFFNSLENGYTDIVNDLLPYMIEGFEWNKNLPKLVSATSIKQVCSDNIYLKRKALIATAVPSPIVEVDSCCEKKPTLRQVAGKIKRKLLR